jgi:hypothetical protein
MSERLNRLIVGDSAALVGAAIVSTPVFPLVGLRLRAGRAATDLSGDLGANAADRAAQSSLPVTGNLEADPA